MNVRCDRYGRYLAFTKCIGMPMYDIVIVSSVHMHLACFFIKKNIVQQNCAAPHLFRDAEEIWRLSRE